MRSSLLASLRSPLSAFRMVLLLTAASSCTLNSLAQNPSPGTLDATFNPVLGTLAYDVFAVKVQPDGKILIGGDFGSVNGASRKRLARLNEDGSNDPAFVNGAGADDYVRVIALDAQGRIVVGGDFTTLNGASWRGVGRLTSNGSIDSSFGQFSGVNGKVLALAIQPDGKIVIGGSFSQVNGTPRSYVARLNEDGSLDGSFNTTVDDQVQALAVRSTGEILMGGQFTFINNIQHAYLAQLKSSGTVDNSFAVAVDGGVRTITVQTNGQALIGGEFTYVNGTQQSYIARLNTDGARDGAFTANSSGYVFDIAVEPSGKIVMAGRFSSVNGTTRNNIARLNPNGLLDLEFDTGVGPSYTVYSVDLQSDGKILIGGEFDKVALVSRTYVARLFGDAPPPPPTIIDKLQIFTAVEFGWPSESNAVYQVQRSYETDPSHWENFGAPVTGNGTTNWVFDTTRESPRKFYRVLRSN